MTYWYFLGVQLILIYLRILTLLMETRWRHDSERLNSPKPISFFSGALSMFVLTVVQGYAHHVFSLWYRLLRCLNRVCLYRLSAVTTNWLSVVNGERPPKPQEIPSWTGPIESLKFLWLHWSNLTLKQVFKKVSIALFCTVKKFIEIIYFLQIDFRCFRIYSGKRSGHCRTADSSPAISIGS